jgi:hypothetical protein
MPKQSNMKNFFNYERTQREESKEKQQIYNEEEKQQIYNEEEKQQTYNEEEKQQTYNEEEKQRTYNEEENQQTYDEEEKHFNNKSKQFERKNNYERFRELYKKNDYVPLNHISTIMSYHFTNDTSIIYDYNMSTKLLKIKICDLFPNKIYNWECNRDPDYIRIPTIAKNIYETRRNPIKTIFYVNYNFKTDKFELIDGCHRFKALEMLLSLSYNNGKIIEDNLRNENNDEIAEWFDNYNIDWLLNDYIIAHVCFQASITDLQNLRENINLSQPMTYRKNPVFDEKYQVINQLADNYQVRYKKNFSDSNNESYLKTNGMTNRNKFIELLSILYDKYNIDVNRIGILQQHLNSANDKLYNDVIEGRIKCSEKTKKRCDETGCYLFIYKNNVLENVI